MATILSKEQEKRMSWELETASSRFALECMKIAVKYGQNRTETVEAAALTHAKVCMIGFFDEADLERWEKDLNN